MDALQQIVLALVQGLTGAAPISGAGHALILTDLLDWPPVSTRTWAPLSFAASLGAGLGLFLSLARDWAGLLRPAAAQARRATLLAAIPPTLAAGFVLPVLHSPVSSAEVACAALIANGALLFLAERRRRAPQATVAALSPARALGIGALEALGLLPGLSRVGLGMAAGGLAGLPYGAGARLALMAATPAALASAAVSLGQARGRARCWTGPSCCRG